MIRPPSAVLTTDVVRVIVGRLVCLVSSKEYRGMGNMTGVAIWYCNAVLRDASGKRGFISYRKRLTLVFYVGLCLVESMVCFVRDSESVPSPSSPALPTFTITATNSQAP